MRRSEMFERVRLCRARTVMANAFRRAFGLQQRWDGDVKRERVADADAYAGIAECFANLCSPMDRRP